MDLLTSPIKTAKHILKYKVIQLLLLLEFLCFVSRCGRGHLKKDLDWMPPPPTANIFGRIEEIDTNGAKKKKRRNRNSRPSLTIGPVGQIPEVRNRAGSLSCSSTGSSSPPASGSEPSVSPVHGAYSKKKSKVDLPDRIR